MPMVNYKQQHKNSSSSIPSSTNGSNADGASAPTATKTAVEMQQPPSAKVLEQVAEQAACLEFASGDHQAEASGLLSWLRWNQFSPAKLRDSENRLLSRVSSIVERKYVPVRHWNSNVYTISVKPPADQPENSSCPFVLVHGFAAGIGVWSATLDRLSKKRTVHAFDLLGFGRSSRPLFSKDPTLAELEFVQSIEDWRRAMGIEQMILVGHSFGGYLASSYALEHPSRVRHLFLADPWGFPERPTNIEQHHIPVWMRALGKMFSSFNPLAPLRAAGPFGVRLVKLFRPDLGTRYAHQDPDAIYQYIYQCNAPNPTGEMAFYNMSQFGWARRPMIRRFNGIDPSVPVTFVWGGMSWMDPGSSYEIQARRQDSSYIDVKILSRAGHHLYADNPVEFCAMLGEISDRVDSNMDMPGTEDSEEWRDQVFD